MIYPFLIFLAVSQVVVPLCAGVFYLVRLMATNPELIYDFGALNKALLEWMMQNALILTMMSQLLCLAPLIPIWMVMRRTMPLFGRKSKPVTFGLLAVPAFFGLSLLIGLLLSFVDVGETYEALETILTSGSVVLRFFTLAVVAPVVEELCFRGIILGRSLSWLRPGAAIFFQAALFGVGHMNLVQGLYAFVLGAMFGYLYFRFRSLWLCMLGHFSFNLPSVVMTIIQDTGAEIPLYWILIPGVVMLTAAFFLYRLPAAVPVTVFGPQRFPPGGAQPVQPLGPPPQM